MSKDRSDDDDKKTPPVRGNYRDEKAPPRSTNQIIVSVQTPPGIPFTVIINGRIIES
jgi:hypothetical protein